jgi:hypothetical protein
MLVVTTAPSAFESVAESRVLASLGSEEPPVKPSKLVTSPHAMTDTQVNPPMTTWCRRIPLTAKA